MSDVRNEFVTANGLRFHYRDWGGSGPPIVLLHGLSSNARIWDFVARDLSSDWRVLALDQRSHGGSEGPEDGYGWPEVTSDLAAYLDGVGLERPLIVGHSWGANVAASFAATFPERPAAIALVDGGTSGFSSSPEMTWERVREMLAPPKLKGVARARLVEGMSKGDLREVWSSEIEAIIMAGFEVLPDDTIAPRLSFERHMKIVRALWEYDAEDLLPRIRCPVLILPATRVRSVEMLERKREAVRRAEELTSKARTVWLEDSIHDVPLQRPEAISGALRDFAQDIYASSGVQTEPAESG